MAGDWDEFVRSKCSLNRWRLVSLSGLALTALAAGAIICHPAVFRKLVVTETAADAEAAVALGWFETFRLVWSGQPLELRVVMETHKAAAHSAHWAVQSSVSHYEKVEEVFHPLGGTSVRGHHGIRLLVNLESYYAGAHKGQESSS